MYVNVSYIMLYPHFPPGISMTIFRGQSRSSDACVHLRPRGSRHGPRHQRQARCHDGAGHGAAAGAGDGVAAQPRDAGGIQCATGMEWGNLEMRGKLGSLWIFHGVFMDLHRFSMDFHGYCMDFSWILPYGMCLKMGPQEKWPEIREKMMITIDKP